MEGMEKALVENLQTFVAFTRRRVGDLQLAEDLVQESFAKALAAENQPTEEQETVVWFYRILRRSIIDLYRRKEARSRALARFEEEFADDPSAEERKELCGCFRRLLPMLPESYREVLERIDLDGMELGEMAVKIGVSRNNLTVRLHRARKELRELVTRNCKACAVHGCLDCSCGEGENE